LWTITRLRLKRDRRGVSNIIVVVLSLVIVVVIIANIVLWSYEMNQLDWEKMKEEMTITNVERVARSSWFVAQNEYIVNQGSHINGTYTDTQAADNSYETFTESLTASVTLHPNDTGQYSEWGIEYPSGVAHWDCCDEDSPDNDTSYVQTDVAAWKKEAYNLEDHSGSQTINWIRVYVRAKLTMSGMGSVRTLIRTHDIDYESSDLTLATSYEDKYTQYDTNPYTGEAWTWDEINSLQAGALGKKFPPEERNIRMTAVWVVVNYTTADTYELDLNGTFSIDTSSYPLTCIQTVEIQLRYRADDAGEKWYLKAYNWTAATYSDSGFNSTAGHTPTTGWDYYAVNLTDKWQSYVQDDGTIYVKFVDEGADSNQTTVDIDFLGVRAEIDGTRFTFKNEGALTSHLVSLWIINSTNHQRYDINVFVNSAETKTYLRSDISLPESPYTVKAVTERGNTAIYSES
jgi:hypothetical protein